MGYIVFLHFLSVYVQRMKHESIGGARTGRSPNPRSTGMSPLHAAGKYGKSHSETRQDRGDSIDAFKERDPNSLSTALYKKLAAAQDCDSDSSGTRRAKKGLRKEAR